MQHPLLAWLARCIKLGVAAILRQAMNIRRCNILADAWQNISSCECHGHD